MGRVTPFFFDLRTKEHFILFQGGNKLCFIREKNEIIILNLKILFSGIITPTNFTVINTCPVLEEPFTKTALLSQSINFTLAVIY